MTEIEPDMAVDIARDGLRHGLHFEHSRGTVYETDVDVPQNTHRRVQLQSTRRRRRVPSILSALGARPNGGGPVVEVASYRNTRQHEEATYHHVYFESGGQGVYPETCLVPAPEETLESNE